MNFLRMFGLLLVVITQLYGIEIPKFTYDTFL